ncbi:MAG: hypothetical protein E6J07_10300, partial [Chloroflexi bacterium]
MVGILDAEEPVFRGQPQLEQGPKGSRSVDPGELLALFAAAGVVRDRDFVNAIAEAENASRDLGLDVEPVTVQTQPAHQFCAHRLESGLHVLDVAIEEHVSGGGEDAVAQHEPVGVGTLAGKAAHAIDDIRTPLQKRIDHDLVLERVVLEVR